LTNERNKSPKANVADRSLKLNRVAFGTDCRRA
jgi:hypothetical protein